MSRFTYLPAALTAEGVPHATSLPGLDPDHHLWKNGRLWWIAFTIHTRDWRKRRLRFSLRTADIREARRRRDVVLRHYDLSDDCALSLRYARAGG
jgi:hypothetical protein